jgi:hypothetical protein
MARPARPSRTSSQARPKRPGAARRPPTSPVGAASLDILAIRMISSRQFEQLGRAMREAGRSLRRPASAILIETLNRVHERIVEGLTEQPDVLALIEFPHDAAHQVGFPRWEGEPDASLSEVLALLRSVEPTGPTVH